MSQGVRRQQCVREPGASNVSGSQASSNKPGAREPAMSQVREPFSQQCVNDPGRQQ